MPTRPMLTWRGVVAQVLARNPQASPSQIATAVDQVVPQMDPSQVRDWENTKAKLVSGGLAGGAPDTPDPAEMQQATEAADAGPPQLTADTATVMQGDEGVLHPSGSEGGGSMDTVGAEQYQPNGKMPSAYDIWEMRRYPTDGVLNNFEDKYGPGAVAHFKSLPYQGGRPTPPDWPGMDQPPGKARGNAGRTSENKANNKRQKQRVRVYNPETGLIE